MNLNKDYYKALGVKPDDSTSQIKKKYYKLSFTLHPDKGGDPVSFAQITEAYDVLCNEELRSEYDLKSKFGANYNEYFELFNIDVVNFDYETGKSHLENFKKNEVLNIRIEVEPDFSGKLEYERWVKCKSCDGSGKDHSSKIVIRDLEGNIVKTFESDDGCDFCEGSGKDYLGSECNFCFGKGKVGLNPCKTCGGERRILGKQKINGIKLTGEETKIDSLGHHSKTEAGSVGYLLIVIRKDQD